MFPKDNTPVDTITTPQTIYGVAKLFNEHLGAYYNRRFGVDFRSLRYPGVISSQKYAFNGVGCWASCNYIDFYQNLEMTFEAVEKGVYKSWLKPETRLPMIYIDDCLEASVKYNI